MKERGSRRKVQINILTKKLDKVIKGLINFLNTRRQKTYLFCTIHTNVYNEFLNEKQSSINLMFKSNNNSNLIV